MVHARFETRLALTRFVLSVFSYEVELLVDVYVCVCKLTNVFTDMYIIANSYRTRIRCHPISKNSDIVT